MAYRHRVQKRAEGGRIQVPGTQVIEEARAKDDGFKRGGRMKKGGIADGAKAADRLDKAPRRASGGRVAMKRGGSPYSAAGGAGKDAPSKGSECA